jgi:hypothetical protein
MAEGGYDKELHSVRGVVPGLYRDDQLHDIIAVVRSD